MLKFFNFGNWETLSFAPAVVEFLACVSDGGIAFDDLCYGRGLADHYQRDAGTVFGEIGVYGADVCSGRKAP